MRDFLLRCADQATFHAQAEAYGLMARSKGQLVLVRGVHIDEIGPMVITPPVMSEDGMTMVTPPVMDMRHHVNLRIVEPAMSAVDDQGRNKVETLTALWSAGAPAETNAGETATEVQGVEWVRGVSSQSRVWE